MQTAYVQAEVATVWTSPTIPREIDRPAVKSQPSMADWLANLTTEGRNWLITAKAVQTQVLYGTQVLITEELNGWSHVLIPDQPTPKNKAGYPGWIPSAQLVATAAVFDEHYTNRASAWIISQNSVLTSTSGTRSLAYMTRLPLHREEQDKIYVYLPSGEEGWLPKQDTAITSTRKHEPNPYFPDLYPMLPFSQREHLLAWGSRFIGLAYLWSGMSSYGYDCSGFVHTLHKARGVLIPRDASAQFRFAQELGLGVTQDQLQPGDLVYFRDHQQVIHHVGIYAGSGQFLHASNSEKHITFNRLSEGRYLKEYCGAARF
jgi:hypothetical protein